MNPQLQAMLDVLIGMARQNLERDGHLMPVAFLFYGRSFDVIGCPWANDADKEATVLKLRDRARAKNAEAIAILAEAWHATLPAGEQWDGTPAGQMPNRREVVQVYVEEQDGYWLGLAPITRDTGRPTFGAVQWQPLPERSAVERFQKILA
jgi:hypothetical protein